MLELADGIPPADLQTQTLQAWKQTTDFLPSPDLSLSPTQTIA